MKGPARAAIDAARNLQDLYQIFANDHLTAGWHKKRRSLWGEPRTKYRPLHWRYANAALALDRAGEWMSTEDAERRNLLMFNPVDDNDYDTVRTIVAAYQMIKPGEYAKTHRHSPNAMRLILDAEPDVYTVVNGVKLPMRPGDFQLTPNWFWHSHYNEGQANAYWIDFLDVPLVHRLEPMFAEESPAIHQTVEAEADPNTCALVFTRARVLAEMGSQRTLAGGGKRLLLQTQQHIPTLSVSYLQLPKGASTGAGRTTASRIFAVTSGEGRARLGDTSVDWVRGDVFCLPSWHSYEITVGTDSLILEVSDEPTLRMLGFFREEPPTLPGASPAKSSTATTRPA